MPAGPFFNRHFDKLSANGRGMATSLVPLLQRCHYIRHVCQSSATLRYACMYSATLSDLHTGFIYSASRVCKVLLHQAGNLVCYKPTRHAYRLGAPPTELLNLSATILDAVLNISNSE